MFHTVNYPRSVDKGCPKDVAKVVPEPMRLTEAQLKGIFKRFDTNGDGRLSRKELEGAFKSLGSYFPGWRAGQALHQADDNGDGYISEDELDSVVKYASKLGYTVK